MPDVEWTWERSSDLAYKGTSRLGMVLFIWKPDGWTVWAFPRGKSGARVDGEWNIPLARGWDQALVDGTGWAEWALQDYYEKNKPPPPPPRAKPEAAPEPDPEPEPDPFWWDDISQAAKEFARETRSASRHAADDVREDLREIASDVRSDWKDFRDWVRKQF